MEQQATTDSLSLDLHHQMGAPPNKALHATSTPLRLRRSGPAARELRRWALSTGDLPTSRVVALALNGHLYRKGLGDSNEVGKSKSL